MINKIKRDLQDLEDAGKAEILARFFKTGKGEYGEGDEFIGVTVPETRKIARKYIDLSFRDISQLLDSKVHEHRLAALLILVERYKKEDGKGKDDIYQFYWKNARRVNNWDLVDLSADKIVGEHLLGKDKDLLYKLAKSDNLWERRIATISTFAFIKRNRFDETFKIAKILLNDRHDLIQKAVGWMLREVGKRNQREEEQFLMKHYKNMPRTMLRYAIERFDDSKRKFYMAIQ